MRRLEMNAGYLQWAILIFSVNGRPLRFRALMEWLECWFWHQSCILISISLHHRTICVIYYACTLASHKLLPAWAEQIRGEVLVLTSNLLGALLNKYYPVHVNSILLQMKNVYSSADKSTNVWCEKHCVIIRENQDSVSNSCYWSLKSFPASYSEWFFRLSGLIRSVMLLIYLWDI